MRGYFYKFLPEIVMIIIALLLINMALTHQLSCQVKKKESHM